MVRMSEEDWILHIKLLTASPSELVRVRYGFLLPREQFIFRRKGVIYQKTMFAIDDNYIAVAVRDCAQIFPSPSRFVYVLKSDKHSES